MTLDSYHMLYLCCVQMISQTVPVQAYFSGYRVALQIGLLALLLILAKLVQFWLCYSIL